MNCKCVEFILWTAGILLMAVYSRGEMHVAVLLMIVSCYDEFYLDLNI